MTSIWHMFSDTPWHVYVLLIFLINIGVRTSRTQVLPLRKLFVMPLIFTVLSIHTLATSVAFNNLNIIIFFVNRLFSACLGWLQVARYSLKVDKEQWLIKVPGNWSTLAIILFIFVYKYYIGYQLAVHPQILGQPDFEMTLLAITGLCTGFFLGKLTCYMYQISKLPSVELVKS
jgi:hypothetical protein